MLYTDGELQRFKRADFDRDFYLDQVVLRRIQRAQQASNNLEMDVDSEDEDDDGDTSVIPRGQRLQPGKRPKQERT